MAVLWSRSSDRWEALLLGAEPVVLAMRPSLSGAEAAPVSLRPPSARSPAWALLGDPAPRPVAVNGESLGTGLRILRDRDEIRLPAGGRYFFSTETLAAVVPFPGPDTVRCARCHQPVVPGRPAVRCPSARCGLWHHEDEETGLRCWTYDDVCARCDQPTDLENPTLRWSPEDL